MDLFDLAAKITLDSSEYEKGIKGAAEKAQSTFGSKLATAAKVGATAIAAASSAVAGFVGSSVKVGASFESSMSQVAATMGYTVDELNTAGSEAAETYATLSAFAQQMGSTTAFSASQAADALNYMALAGYDAETSMSVLPTVLNLAAAGGIDLAYASDMVTDASSALGLSIDETTDLVDQMARASSKSNTSVEQLGEAILTIGATARSVSGGTVELSTILGALADNGIKGAEGGTHLRNMILSLQSPTDDAKAALDSLGIAIYDSDGNMRSMVDIVGDLQEGIGDMDGASRDAIISGIFNKTDLAAVNALLNTSQERFDELSASIADSSGAAEQMAAVQLDNLEGDITLFKSALEGAQIAISEGLMPSLRDFVQFGSGAISTLTQAFQEGGLSGAMGALGGIISDALAMITDMLPEIVEAGAELLMSLTSGVIENLPLLVDVALQIITMLATGLAENLPELIPTIVDVILQIVNTLTDPANLTSLVEAAIAIIMGLANGLIAALPQLIAQAPVIISNLVTAILQNLPLLIDSGVQLIVQLVAAIGSALPQLLQAGLEIVSTVAEGLVNAFGTLVEKGAEIVTKVKEGFSSAVDGAKQWGKDLIDNFKAGLVEKWNSLKETVSNVAGTIKDLLGFSEPKEGPLSNFHTYAPDMMDLFAKGIRDNENVVRAQIEKSFDFGEIGTINGTAPMVGTSSDSGIVSAMQEMVSAIQGMGFYMDTGVLVGQVSPGVDNNLGGRYNYAQKGLAV